MFCSEVNSEGYSEIEEPIRLREKHYSPARYMLKQDIRLIETLFQFQNRRIVFQMAERIRANSETTEIEVLRRKE